MGMGTGAARGAIKKKEASIREGEPTFTCHCSHRPTISGHHSGRARANGRLWISSLPKAGLQVSVRACAHDREAPRFEAHFIAEKPRRRDRAMGRRVPRLGGDRRRRRELRSDRRGTLRVLAANKRSGGSPVSSSSPHPFLFFLYSDRLSETAADAAPIYLAWRVQARAIGRTWRRRWWY